MHYLLVQFLPMCALHLRLQLLVPLEARDPALAKAWAGFACNSICFRNGTHAFALSPVTRLVDAPSERPSRGLHQIVCFDPAHIRFRVRLESFSAQWTAQGHYELTIPDASEPLPACDRLLAYGTLHKLNFWIPGIELSHLSVLTCSRRMMRAN